MYLNSRPLSNRFSLGSSSLAPLSEGNSSDNNADASTGKHSKDVTSSDLNEHESAPVSRKDMSGISTGFEIVSGGVSGASRGTNGTGMETWSTSDIPMSSLPPLYVIAGEMKGKNGLNEFEKVVVENEAKERRNTIARQKRREEDNKRRVLKKMLFYPGCYLLVWMIPFINRVLDLFMPPIYGLVFIEAMCVPLQGLLDAIIFIWSERVWRGTLSKE
ncbi:hypothetical protein BKA69DRAFT_869336 [Paraphysoderma sedebokerense]|nr:hypothetical protein BKA69DRAFT_869336 [Paraphysoderma sedebokerense]